MNNKTTGILWTHSSLEEHAGKLLKHTSHQDSIAFFCDALIKIKPLKFIQPMVLKDIQTVFITSRHALPAFKKCVVQDVSIFTVGDHTAEIAQKFGFKDIFSSRGNAMDLRNLIVKMCSPKKGPLLYVRGVHIHRDLKGELEEIGFNIYEEIVYDAVPTNAFLPETIKNLKNNNITDVFLFSTRGSEIFMNLINLSGLKNILKGLRVFCLSPNIATTLRKEDWREIQCAPQPTIDAIVTLFMKKPH